MGVLIGYVELCFPVVFTVFGMFWGRVLRVVELLHFGRFRDKKKMLQPKEIECCPLKLLLYAVCDWPWSRASLLSWYHIMFMKIWGRNGN